MEQSRRERRRSLARAGLIAILVVAGAGAAMSMMSMQSMRSQSITAAQLRQSPPASPVDVTIELTSAAGDRFSGRLLEPSGKDSYRRTTIPLSFTVGASAKLVMGERTDLRPGAVIVARGRPSNNEMSDIDRVVVLTGYVHVN